MTAQTAPELNLEFAASSPDHSALLWRWSYAADGIFAHGVLTTTAMANAEGFYRITDISGERNGEAIVGLQPAGTAIPGNEPFAVDNLISADGPHLTANGFGYALGDGTFANPFFADFLVPAGYLEFFSAPPFGPGIGPEDSELPVDFAAHALPPSHAHHRPGHDSPHHQDEGCSQGRPMHVMGHGTTFDWLA